MKKMQLGKAEVTFTHQFVSNMIWSEKNHRAISVIRPVATTATVTVNGTTSVSKVTCHVKDNFRYEKGRKLSLARAIQSNPELKDKKVRARIWDDYSKLKPGGRW